MESLLLTQAKTPTTHLVDTRTKLLLLLLYTSNILASHQISHLSRRSSLLGTHTSATPGSKLLEMLHLLPHMILVLEGGRVLLLLCLLLLSLLLEMLLLLLGLLKHIDIKIGDIGILGLSIGHYPFVKVGQWG